ncbi:MAG: cell division protein SepF [Clostridia bacterium]|nr:cell division protein SepF [Clostridia bacterium]
MSFFKFITESSDEKTEKQENKTLFGRKKQTASKGTIDVFHPRSFDEVASIIDKLCSGKPAIVHLNELSEATAQRVIDLLSGAVYAINGNLSELEKDVYIFTPHGVKTEI